jgi:hexosaminidase
MSCSFYHLLISTVKFILTIVICCLFCISYGQSIDTPALFPKPQSIRSIQGKFTLSAATVIVADEAAKPSVTWLNNYLKKQYGFQLKESNTANKNYIKLVVKKLLIPGVEGKYNFLVNSSSVNISGDTYSGIFYGVQTLLQLIENTDAKNKNSKTKSAASYTIPCVEITDEPRFAYRGMHLDVSRHFFDVAYVKKYIDYLAAYKFNTFHWHLTDDQGWRIEIKKYPKLISVGGYRNGTIIGRYPGKGNDGLRYGGFYTQEQIKEVVKYAAERYITVIPEIEMPGHASAAIAAYPQLSCFPNESTKPPPQCAWAGDTTGKHVQQTWGVFEDVFCPSEYTFIFLQDVLDEVMLLFPSQYIHIGGDECPKTAWKRSAFCQQLMKERGLKDEHELQSYFVQRIEKYINSKGRKIIGWDEILEGGLAPNATVMSWTGEKGGITAAQQNHDVVMTPGTYCYFDHSQSKNEDSVTFGSYLPLETVYSYDPVPSVLNETEAKRILGAQANLWTEYITNPAKIEYMLFPRIVALSEVLWTKKENKNWDDFEKRLPVLFERLQKRKVNYSNAYYDIIDSIFSAPNGSGVVWKASSKLNMYRRMFIFSKYVTDTVVSKDIVTGIDSVIQIVKDSSSRQLINSGLYSSSLAEFKNDSVGYFLSTVSKRFSFNKATGKKITLTTERSKSYPGNGAFTLVDGIQNDRRLERSAELLGFSGKDCEVVIDLGRMDTISRVIVHSLNQQPSWIHLPKTIEVSISSDGENYITQPVFTVTNTQPGNNAITVPVVAMQGRFVKIKITNAGKIPDGMPGAGNPAWLMVDEIEIW